jgi:hypothetical protein
MRNKPPLLESDKQTKPMPGEAAPEDVAKKARLFAAQEKLKLKSKKTK